MKAIIILFLSLISVQTINAAESDLTKRKKGAKTEVVKQALDNQVNKHIFNPTVKSDAVEGEANVMLRVMPEGNVQVVLIQTKNPIIAKFIERQVNKMKVDKEGLVIGEIFKYRFVFKTQN